MPTRAAAAPVITIQWTQLPEWKLLVRYNLRFFVQVGHETTYRISLYSFRFRGNYFFFWIYKFGERSPNIIVRKLFKGGNYMRKYSIHSLEIIIFSLNHVTVRPAEIIKPL